MNRNRHHRRRPAAIFAALVLLLFGPGIAGCQHGTAVPTGWAATRAPDDPPQAVRMQVMVCYGWKFSSHALVRFTAPGEPPLLWDPGGDYRLGDPGVWRAGCLVLDPVPTVESYWAWRRDTQGEPLMEAFEFTISEASFRAMRRALVEGSLPDPQPEAFPAVRRAGACATSVSDLLICYGAPRIRLNRRYCMPDALAQFLWTQHPDRVYLFTAAPPQQLTYVEKPATTAHAAAPRPAEPGRLGYVSPASARGGG